MLVHPNSVYAEHLPCLPLIAAQATRTVQSQLAKEIISMLKFMHLVKETISMAEVRHLGDLKI